MKQAGGRGLALVAFAATAGSSAQILGVRYARSAGVFRLFAPARRYPPEYTHGTGRLARKFACSDPLLSRVAMPSQTFLWGTIYDGFLVLSASSGISKSSSTRPLMTVSWMIRGTSSGRTLPYQIPCG